MAFDVGRDSRIKLHRHAAKLWSYNGSKPGSVEIAALDFLRSHGIDGYFTERDNYLGLLFSLIGWPGNLRSRLPGGFGNPHLVYFCGSDGWLRVHKFSFSQVLAEVDAATFAILEKKLIDFCFARPRGLGYFSSSQSQPAHILKFLEAFGISELKERVRNVFHQDKLDSLRKLHQFDCFVDQLNNQKHRILSSLGLELKATAMPLSPRAFNLNGGFNSYIDQTEDFAAFVVDEILKAKILDACRLARSCREETVESYNFATLDLQVWDVDGCAIVEVKAPGDRLKASQRNTIELARSKGSRASVIYIDVE